MAVPIAIAIARGHILAREDVVSLFHGTPPQMADALERARQAGIDSTALVSDLLTGTCSDQPDSVKVIYEIGTDSISIESLVRSEDSEQVDLLALTVVSVTGLALFEMIKTLDPGATLNRVRLAYRGGGQTKRWEEPVQPL